MIEINAQDAVTNAEKALKEKRLLFFDPVFMAKVPSQRKCRHFNNGYVDSISASVPEEAKESFNMNWDLHLLVFHREIKSDNLDCLADLQGAHDNSCMRESVDTAKKDFKQRLTEIKKQYNLQ